VTVVIATRNRGRSLLGTLRRPRAGQRHPRSPWSTTDPQTRRRAFQQCGGFDPVVFSRAKAHNSVVWTTAWRG